MIPILYAKNETDFLHNGIGFLRDTAKATVTEERNGSYELSLQYPITGQWYDRITEGCIIKAKANETSEPQLFRVYKSSKPLKGLVTYSAEHISYDLNGIPTLGFSIKSATPQMAINRAIEEAGLPCPFSVISDISTLNSTSIPTPCSVRAILGGQEGSVLDVWGGEYEFDNFVIKLHEQRGADNGVLIEYGKNLKDLKQEANIADCYTHLMPYAVYQEDGEDDEEKQEVYVFLSEKVLPLQKAENIGHNKAYIMDFSAEFGEDEKITEAALREKATAYAAGAELGAPKVSITVSFIQLWQTEEYKNIAPLERVKLCDTVTVHFSQLGVNASAKVIKTVYDSLAEKYESVELGDAKSTLADTINAQNNAIEQIKDSIRKGQAKASEELKKAILNATNLITGHSGGYVVLNPAEKPQEILILDAPTIEEAVKVWRWNSGGLGYSSTGYNGEFALAMTMDGAIVADFITAGALNGVLLQADSVKASAISAEYKQEVTDAIGNVESSVTQAFKVADQELLSSINVKLADYATTEEMSSAIKQSADTISLTVTAARTYAETLAADAESGANEYTDGKLTSYPTKTEMSSEITQLADKISLVVTSTSGGNVIDSASIIAAINDDTSSVSINAGKIDLTAYAKTSEVYDEAYEAAGDAIYDGITLTTTNGSTSSTIRIKHNGVTIDSASVSFSGVVTFSDLETAGYTTINGSNITTGTISADRISTNIAQVAGNLYIGSSSASGTKSIIFNSGAQMGTIGDHLGSSSPTGLYFSGSSVRFTGLGNDSGYDEPMIYANGYLLATQDWVLDHAGSGTSVAVFG
ncbi:MAG: phage tail protein [Clostridia bacterium]|nr:phage tail protein [Clostridia bacterium]